MEPPPTPRSSLGMVALAAATWGTWSLFLRPAERVGKPAAATESLVVFAIIGLALAPVALRRRPREPRPARAWVGMAASGAVDAGNVLCFFAAMQRTTLAVAVLTHYLAPVFVAVAAPIVLREPARRATVGALALSLGGLALLLEPWRAAADGVAAGAALGAASAVFYAANVLLTKSLARSFAPSEVVAWHSFPAALALAPFAVAGGIAIAPASLGWIALGALLPGAAAGLLFMRGLARVPASQAAVLTLLEPLVAVAIGVAVWGERIGATGVAGGAAMLAGAWIVLRGPRPRAAA